MDDVAWITAFFSLLITGLGLGFHFWARPRIARRMGAMWPPQGPSPHRRRWASGEAPSRFSVGGMLLLSAPAIALGIAFARPEALSAGWMVVPQALIGLAMAITAWPQVRPQPFGPRARAAMLIGVALWVGLLVAWFFGLRALGQSLEISLVGALALGFATTLLGLLALRLLVALRMRPR